MSAENRVLIIDDDKWIAMSTSMLLEAEGFEVYSALGGVEGLELARSLQPAVILLDLMMPGLDGWETLDRIKQDHELGATPVVVFTAREHSQGRARSREHGAVEYLRKPFRIEALLQAIRRHTGTQSPAP